MQIVRDKEVEKFYISDLKVGDVFSFRSTIKPKLNDEITPDDVFLLAEFGIDLALINLKSGLATSVDYLLGYEIVQYKNATLTI